MSAKRAARAGSSPAPGSECPCGGAMPQGTAAAARKRPGPPEPPCFAACCGRFIAGDAVPATALELMRSRYSAYVVGDTDYLRATWDPLTCPGDLALDIDAPDAPRWLGLEVKRFETLDENHAIVEFVARFKTGARGHRLHEVSRFARGEDGRWRYVDGDVSEH